MEFTRLSQGRREYKWASVKHKRKFQSCFYNRTKPNHPWWELKHMERLT